MLELIGKTNIDFLGRRHVAYAISILLSIAAAYIWVARGESKYDIDFTGGHEFIVQTPAEGSSDGLRVALKTQGIGEVLVQSFEAASHQFSIKIGGRADEAKVIRDKVATAVKATYPQGGDVLQSDFVGPTVGEELKVKALLAVALSLLGIVIYLTVRFEFAFALGALVALVHDVIVATGIYLFAGHDINMAAVAAALTIIGYSVNDTIVIFDKVREEIFKRQQYELIPLMNECINLMLSRTIITSGLTLTSALALYLLGGGSIADLSFYLTIGIICGTYSTVFIATPVVFTWESFRSKSKKAA